MKNHSQEKKFCHFPIVKIASLHITPFLFTIKKGNTVEKIMNEFHVKDHQKDYTTRTGIKEIRADSRVQNRNRFHSNSPAVFRSPVPLLRTDDNRDLLFMRETIIVDNAFLKELENTSLEGEILSTTAELPSLSSQSY